MIRSINYNKDNYYRPLELLNMLSQHIKNFIKIIFENKFKILS